MFTLNNVFLCPDPLRVKFFQISGSTLQLQRDRNSFTAVGRVANAGSVWTPSASRLSTLWMEKPISATVGAAAERALWSEEQSAS